MTRIDYGHSLRIKDDKGKSHHLGRQADGSYSHWFWLGRIEAGHWAAYWMPRFPELTGKVDIVENIPF